MPIAVSQEEMTKAWECIIFCLTLLSAIGIYQVLTGLTDDAHAIVLRRPWVISSHR